MAWNDNSFFILSKQKEGEERIMESSTFLFMLVGIAIILSIIFNFCDIKWAWARNLQIAWKSDKEDGG